jgi:hypothetical protein
MGRRSGRHNILKCKEYLKSGDGPGEYFIQIRKVLTGNGSTSFIENRRSKT